VESYGSSLDGLSCGGAGKHPAVLRNDITSPGGTTASALYVLERGTFRTTLADSIWAAYRRALELVRKSPCDHLVADDDDDRGGGGGGGLTGWARF